MADQADDDMQMDDLPAVQQTAEFSQRLGAMMNSAYWSPSRPGGNGWDAGPDHPPGSCTYEVASEWGSKALDERDALRDEMAKFTDYDKMPKPLREKLDVIERFGEFWFDMESRAIQQATEALTFHPTGTIHLTEGEKASAAKAAQMARDDGKPEIAKWFEESVDANPNAVRSVLADMGLDDEE